MESISLMLEQKSLQNNNEGCLARAMLDYEGDYRNLKIREIVEIAHVSNSTATRLAQSLGLVGFKELCYDLAIENDNIINQSKIYYNDVIDSYMMEFNAALINSSKLIDYNLIIELAKKIVNSKYVLLLSIGSTQLRAMDFSYKLRKLGIVAISTSDYHQQEMEAKTSDEDVVALTLSYSGMTEEVIKMAKYAYESGASCYSITSNDSKLNEISKVLNVGTCEPQSRVFSITAVSTLTFILDLIFLEIIKSNPQKYEKLLHETKYEIRI